MAVSAYGNARRQLLDLDGTYAEIDATLLGEYDGERFATGVLARRRDTEQALVPATVEA